MKHSYMSLVLGVAFLIVLFIFTSNCEGFVMAGDSYYSPVNWTPGAPTASNGFGLRAGAPPACTSNGKFLGYPSNDNNIRLYTPADCALLGGTPAGDGECLVPSGGSFSWNCRSLNPIPQLDQCQTNYKCMSGVSNGAITATMVPK